MQKTVHATLGILAGRPSTGREERLSLGLLLGHHSLCFSASTDCIESAIYPEALHSTRSVLCTILRALSTLRHFLGIAICLCCKDVKEKSLERSNLP